MAEKDDARELVLAPNEYASILDKTNGNVYLYVGPKQDTIAQTVQPVIFNEQTKGFDRCDIARATQRTVIAPEGSYAVLENPAKDGKYPSSGARAPMPELDMGRKINIPGPVAFAPWPGQIAKVVPGHTLRSNQYLLVRVYDQTAARKNWQSATIETISSTTAAEGSATTPTTTDGNETKSETKRENRFTGIKAEALTMGQLEVIRGTDVSFFIPPTGVEVVTDQNGKLIRDAVTLERLEYCQLKDENGNKRFERGPAVVFPEPTEVFVTRTMTNADGMEEETRKFLGIELSETSGIYIKVIADYKDESGKDHKIGDELFLTGQDMKLYFPRIEHAIVKYGEHEVHYATAIPAGEGRYVLNRLTGDVSLVKGPQMCLPDPRTQVFARRVLDDRICGLLYPNNNEALLHNRSLKQKTDADAAAMYLYDGAPIAVAAASAHAGLESMTYSSSNVAMRSMPSVSNSLSGRGLGGSSAKGFAGDGFDRKGRYQEPRSVTLNTKYEGAVGTNLWQGSAICLVNKTGDTRVEVGPKTVLFEYGETPQTLKLSTGKPKNMDKTMETTFLQVSENKVTDIVEVETRDFVKMHLKVAYRTNFEGDPKKWFAVENYVKLLCDHMRSRLAASVKRDGIEDFYNSAVDKIRAIVLGAKEGDKPRAGFRFDVNGMHVYDVEVLDVKILDASVESTLVTAQREAISQRLGLANRVRLLDFTTKNEDITRRISEAQAETRFAALTLGQKEIAVQLDHDLTEIASRAKAAAEEHVLSLASEKAQSEIAEIRLERRQEEIVVEIETEKQRQEIQLTKLSAEVEAVVHKAGAITPDLIAALQAFGDKNLIEKLSTSMSPMALIGGESVTDVIKRLLEGTKLANVLTTPTQNGANGGGASKGSSATA